MSCIENPFSVIYDEAGRAMAVSGSQVVDAAQSGFVFFGSSSIGAQAVRVTPTGEVYITGSIDAIASGVQSITGSVYVTNMIPTGSNGGVTVNQGLSSSFADAWKVVITDASGSIFGTNSSPLWVTGSVSVGGVVSVTGSVLTREQPFSNSTVTRVTASTTSATILAANGGRRTTVIFNEGSAKVFIKLGASASTTNYTIQLGAGGSFIIPEGYTGIISAVFSTNTGNVQISELS